MISLTLRNSLYFKVESHRVSVYSFGFLILIFYLHKYMGTFECKKAKKKKKKKNGTEGLTKKASINKNRKIYKKISCQKTC